MAHNVACLPKQPLTSMPNPQDGLQCNPEVTKCHAKEDVVTNQSTQDYTDQEKTGVNQSSRQVLQLQNCEMDQLRE